METQIIYDENGNGFTRIFTTEKVEKVNPVDFYKSYELEKRALALRDLLHSKSPFLSSKLDDSFFFKKAEETLADFWE